MITLKEYRDRTRELLDVDASELSDDLLHLFIREGFNRILRRRRTWKHLETSEEFDSVVDQREYPLADIGDGTVSDVRSVVAMDTNAWAGRLLYISMDEAELFWNGVSDISSTPTRYAIWDETLLLYPKPSQEWTFRVRGYRAPNDWVSDGAGATPDLPEKFHEPLQYWVFSAAYMQQEDPEQASEWQRRFEESVSLLITDDFAPDTAFPIVVNGGRPYQQASWMELNSWRVGS